MNKNTIGFTAISLLVILMVGCAQSKQNADTAPLPESNQSKLDAAIAECDKISDVGDYKRGFCRADVIAATLNFDKCKEAENYSTYCQTAIASRDPSLCGRATDPDICYYNVALRLNEPTICEKIIETYVRDTCFYKLAEKNGNSMLCANIVSDDINHTCGLVSKNEPSECDSLQSEEDRADCLTFVAIRKRDCSVLNQSIAALACRILVGSETNDPAYCKEFGTDISLRNCYAYAAMITLNESLCNSSGNVAESTGYVRTRCWIYIYASRGDALACDSLKDQDAIYECRARTIVNASNASLAATFDTLGGVVR